MKKILLFLLVLPTLLGFSNSYGFGLSKSKNHERPNAGKYTEIINKHNSCYIGEDNKNIYLTFDMGYELGYTTKILDTLKEMDVKACFFITGHFINENADLVKRMHDEGHIVGNHSWNHIDITRSTKEKIEEELNKLNDAYKEITGSDMEKYFRPPKGTFNDESLSILDDLGYKTVFWSLAYKDWDRNVSRGKEYAIDTVSSLLHNGSIILLHTVSRDNQEGLEGIITEAKNQGYMFATLKDL